MSLYQSIFAKQGTYKQDKEEFERTHFKVMRPLMYVEELQDGHFYFRDETELKKAFRNKFTMQPTNEKACEFTKYWINHPDIRTYDTVDFIPPPLVCPKETFNMWRGFAIEKVDVESIGCIEPVLNHIDVLVNHDVKARDYFLKWLAHIIQKPGTLNGIAIVFKSAQGSGKNVFFDFFSRIIGSDLYFETADPVQELWSRFALGRKNKL